MQHRTVTAQAPLTGIQIPQSNLTVPLCYKVNDTLIAISHWVDNLGLGLEEGLGKAS